MFIEALFVIPPHWKQLRNPSVDCIVITFNNKKEQSIETCNGINLHVE